MRAGWNVAGNEADAGRKIVRVVDRWMGALMLYRWLHSDIKGSLEIIVRDEGDGF
jgi:hypothetical protein